MKHLTIRFILLVLCASLSAAASAQRVAVKTNLLYGAATLTPNLGVEIGTGHRTSLDLWGAYNPWNLNGNELSNKKLAHWIAQPEFRLWTCETFNGHFFGVHGIYGKYNIGEYKLPWLFGKDSELYRFEGDMIGAGLSYGYNLVLGKRWNLEFTVGAGVAYLNYSKYECKQCGTALGKFNRTYYGPTKAGISLIFLIK